jgi:membrane associated rhomboid family serine protease
MLIPLSDDNPTRHVPVVTILLVVVNIAVFAWEATMGLPALGRFVNANAFIPAQFGAHPLSLDVWRRIICSMFIHGGWLHVGGNMLYLWIFGNNIEDELGPLKFTAFYLISGIAATVAQFAAVPNSTLPNIGASGAVAGCLGAYLLLFPGVKVLTLIPIFFVLAAERISAFFVIGFWFVLQLLSGIASLGVPATADMGGVAFFAHVGGFAAGLLMALPLRLRGTTGPPDEPVGY